ITCCVMVLATRTSAPNTSLEVIRPKPRPDSPTASEISVIMLKSELPHEASNPVSKKAARGHLAPQARQERPHETNLDHALVVRAWRRRCDGAGGIRGRRARDDLRRFL